MTLQQIENKIERYEAIRDTMTSKADRREMDRMILNLMRDAMDIRRDQAEQDISRGLAEQAAWYDTSAELG